ncbi:MAG: SUMF1/EgtB/PvdO family nonheme iron enzyme, partial [Elusimicrobiota bacterium]
NSGKRIQPVGKKKPNAFGLYDMHGNALEWTADYYNANFYSVSPERNPQGPAEGADRVVRGGSVYVSADLCRAAQRMKGPPTNQYSARGFRCAAPAK